VLTNEFWKFKLYCCLYEYLAGLAWGTRSVDLLLDSEVFSNRLRSSLDNLSGSLVVASAFIKLEAIRSILGNLGNGLSVKVVARWQLNDLVKGSSDLEVYEYCRDKGWRFGINTRLHGKLFLLDSEEFLLGSANLTRRGLNLIENSNLEFGTEFKASKGDLDKLNFFLSNEVHWISDAGYQSMARYVEEAKRNYQITPIEEWPASITNRLVPTVESLWLKDLLSLSPEEILFGQPTDDFARTIDLLNISPENLDSKTLKKGFRNTLIYAWAVQRLSYDPVQFGALTFEIDNLLLDDPRLYRRYLKSYIDILFAWFDYLDDEFEVTERSHGGKGSRSVRLRMGNEQ
jgi:hypothetical protein